MSEVDTNSDEFKQAVAEAVASEVEGLKTKNAELIAKNKKLQAGATVEPADLAAAEAERDEWKGKAQAADKQVKKLTGELETATKRASDIDGAYSNSLRDAALTEALTKAGVVPALLPAAKALLGPQATVIDVDGVRTVKAGDKALSDHITAWASSDEGKHFVAAPDANGGGSHGGRGNNPDKTGDIASDDAGKRVAAIQARLDKNPEYVR